MESIMTALEEFKSYRYARVEFIPGKQIAIITAITDYIPIEEFKEIFNETEELIRNERIQKLVFDKRALKVFHQPSMEWYFIEWKDKMFDLGLKKHRKILPNDEVFRHSVKIGREKILNENPNIKANEMEILYAESLEEAINN